MNVELLFKFKSIEVHKFTSFIVHMFLQFGAFAFYSKNRNKKLVNPQTCKQVNYFKTTPAKPTSINGCPISLSEITDTSKGQWMLILSSLYLRPPSEPG